MGLPADSHTRTSSGGAPRALNTRTSSSGSSSLPSAPRSPTLPAFSPPPGGPVAGSSAMLAQLALIATTDAPSLAPTAERTSGAELSTPAPASRTPPTTVIAADAPPDATIGTALDMRSSVPSYPSRVPKLTIVPGEGASAGAVFADATRKLRSVNSFPRRPKPESSPTVADAFPSPRLLRSVASFPRKLSSTASPLAAAAGQANESPTGAELLRLARKSLRPSVTGPKLSE